MIITKKRYNRDKHEMKKVFVGCFIGIGINTVSNIALSVGQTKLKKSLTHEVSLAASKANAAMMESAKLKTDFADYRASVIKMSKGKGSGLKSSDLETLERMKMG